jgi:hypothetical protein
MSTSPLKSSPLAVWKALYGFNNEDIRLLRSQLDNLLEAAQEAEARCFRTNTITDKKETFSPELHRILVRFIDDLGQFFDYEEEYDV